MQQYGNLAGKVQRYGNLTGKVQIPAASYTSDHATLSNRELPNQHPIGAITGLRESVDSLTAGQEELRTQIKEVTSKPDTLTNEDIEKLLGGTYYG